MFKKVISQTILICLLSNLAACSPYVSWTEEVKLSDGRVILVEQKKRAGAIAREAWLKIKLPEFSEKEIVWHENLIPLTIDINDGKLYVVGYPPTEVECRLYGNPRPFYVGFVWNKDTWEKIPFEKIPAQIYTTNLLIEGFPPKGTTVLSILEKNGKKLNGDATTQHAFKYLDISATCE